jgi:large subunit ribosomal protein L22
MEAIAKQKYLKGSPRKARLVIDLIRGRNVSQALAILKFTNKRAAQPIAKCLNSAIANATYIAEQQNIAIDPDDLWVKTCFVDMGPHKNRRRMRPAPQGRAYREQRHYCHITIEVTSEAQAKAEEKEFEKKGKKVTAKKEGGEKKAETKSAKKTEKKDAAEEVKETKAEETADEVKVEETAKAEMSEEVKAEETPVETAETEAAPEAVTEETAEETPFENKPIAAQTDEEKSGSDMADDAKIDKVEELERQ